MKTALVTGSAAGRFWTKVWRTPAMKCWLWTAGTSRGYGQFWLDGRMHAAHRLSYRMLVGEIPEGLQLDHLCRVRRCVNPAHLEPVTNRVNGLRGESLPAQNARKTHCPQGHEYSPDNIYWFGANKDWRMCATCQKRRVAERRRRNG